MICRKKSKRQKGNKYIPLQAQRYNMPILKPVFFSNSTIHIWHITESIDDLKELYTDELSEHYTKLKSVQHRKQYLAKTLLLKELKIDNLLYYNSLGKPLLKNDAYISISHSGKYVAIGIADKPIGIDLESDSKKLQKIASKFIRADEKPFLKHDEILGLQKIWTAKESIYKLMGKSGLAFKKDIQITDLNMQSGQAKVLKRFLVNLSYERIDEKFLICCTYFN